MGFWKKLFHFRHNFVVLDTMDTCFSYKKILLNGGVETKNRCGVIVIEKCSGCGKEKASFRSVHWHEILDPEVAWSILRSKHVGEVGEVEKEWS